MPIFEGWNETDFIDKLDLDDLDLNNQGLIFYISSLYTTDYGKSEEISFLLFLIDGR